jgi:predicted TIM-barrel fold metal-dependent hydrolase
MHDVQAPPTDSATSHEVRLVDAAVHPTFAFEDDIREYMAEPWRSRPFPQPERYYYPFPGDEWLPGTYPADGGYPGSDPALLQRQVVTEGGADFVVLLPLTRGLNPDLDLSAAICTATNRWLADVWLGGDERESFRGTIRVDPRDPNQAVAEIERWAGHPRMVQIGVPLQTQQPYGQRAFLPVWEAAARHGLPVVVHADGGAGVEFWPTCAGPAAHYVDYAALLPMTFAVHLFSLIAEGVFERLSGLRVVFADGAFDALAPLVWRFDKDWLPSRSEVPWVQRAPSSYLRDHVRFCSSAFDGPPDPRDAARWLEVSDAAHLQMFASNHPHRELHDHETAFAEAGIDRARVMALNACELYGLPTRRG